eukprot:GFUD01023149.1.p1 GENE.GFUD01023149.1~~GFUD01023149.1.p1  ORF type:complete len:143 (-),score=9.51 GFUD01023149.1:1892-2320(-)
MDSKLVFPAALLVLLCLIDTGSSVIQCHQCNSYEQAHCGDPFYHVDDVEKKPKTTDFLKDCPDDGEEYFCRKIYQNVRGDERVIRSCGYIKDERERDCYTTVLEEYNTLVCQCTTDGCNSASMYKVSTVAVVSAVLLAYLIQ